MAPVVMTSSTSVTAAARGSGPRTQKAPADAARLSAAPSRLVIPGASHLRARRFSRKGTPDCRATGRATSVAGLNPRRSAIHGWEGTGTSSLCSDAKSARRNAAASWRPKAPNSSRRSPSFALRRKRFLLRAKLGLRRELFGALGRQLAAAFRRADFASEQRLLVPVPSHPWIALRRGFNPATEVARPVARQSGVPLRENLLARRWLAPGMTKRLGAAERRAASAGAFWVRGPLPRAAAVTLVDDVMTTGATLEACARVLLEAGALRVRAAIWARTLPPGSSRDTRPRVETYKCSR